MIFGMSGLAAFILFGIVGGLSVFLMAAVFYLIEITATCRKILRQIEAMTKEQEEKKTTSLETK